MKGGAGLFIIAGVGVLGAILFSVNRSGATRLSATSPLYPYMRGDVPDAINDRAVADAVNSGIAWADYWTKNLNALYESAGNMPITGPLVTCIAAPCYGTSRPQSP